ncbi:glycosyl hydrolase family 28 protein [Pedobacter sp. Du54]|uniref:glycosyl hydrolase family 28 protein n=1 Tax=Pedobacter anseongensis TaxID=3133439 RepID=UPI0030A8F882
MIIIKTLKRLFLPAFFCLACTMSKAQHGGYINAADYGFSPNATGLDNVKAFQKAVDQSGTIIVSKPGIYKMAGTTYIGSNTTLEFGNGVILQKVDEVGRFTHVILNKGALTKTYDEHITIKDLQVSVNGMDLRFNEVFGLRGQIAFFYVKDLKIEGFRCRDIMQQQFGIHVCTFEDLTIDNVILKGGKDGIHLGRGNRFTISNAVIETVDDAIALNAHDYATSNPELGWIENGVIEKCRDLAGDQKLTGYFCRILAGGWVNWNKGMEVQNADAVVSNGRVYRVDGTLQDNSPDGKNYKSLTRPTHTKGVKELDGIKWVLVQDDVQYIAGVRNVTFRDIYLEKPRTSFSIHFDNSKWSRSYYPGAQIPMQRQLTFDNVSVLHDGEREFMGIDTPIDAITITNSSLGKTGIKFRSNNAMKEYFPTRISISNTVFNAKGEMTLLENTVENKEITLKTSGSIEINENFLAKIKDKAGKVIVQSDLKGLNEK